MNPVVSPATSEPRNWVSQRAAAIDASGIRRVFDLAAKLKDPINLSIGQPDFDVPQVIKQRAIAAIQEGDNRYTPTQGIAPLLQAIQQREAMTADEGALVLSGTSGGILLAMFAALNPGDEVLILDPYFVMYKHVPKLASAVPVMVDTYPDFRLHPERIEQAITSRTRMLVLCSPGNPTGITYTREELEAAAAIARRHQLLVISDEVYDAFCYGRHESIRPLLPGQCVMLKGFSKTYGMTGWRLGYAVGPKIIIEQMTKLQQYTFVCAPAPLQAGSLETFVPGRVDMAPMVAAYRQKRDRMLAGLRDLFEINTPGGAFYIFPRAPRGMSGTEFVRQAIEHNLLIIPGNVFSERDTHFRLSYAAADATIDRGIEVLRAIAKG